MNGESDYRWETFAAGASSLMMAVEYQAQACLRMNQLLE